MRRLNKTFNKFIAGKEFLENELNHVRKKFPESARLQRMLSKYSTILSGFDQGELDQGNGDK